MLSISYSPAYSKCLAHVRCCHLDALAPGKCWPNKWQRAQGYSPRSQASLFSVLSRLLALLPRLPPSAGDHRGTVLLSLTSQSLGTPNLPSDKLTVGWNVQEVNFTIKLRGRFKTLQKCLVTNEMMGLKAKTIPPKKSEG